MAVVTAMQDDLGQRGDIAVASLIAEAHRRCRDCAADQCETGGWAADQLAAYRRSRRTPQQMTGRNQRPTEYQGAAR